MNHAQILTGCFLMFTCFLQAQVMHVSDASTMRILGTSNLHDWATEVTELEGTAHFETQDDGTFEILSAELTIPVLSIHSEKGKKMDKLTYDALNTEQYSTISFSLTSADVETAGGTKTATLTGNLTVSGSAQIVTFEAISQDNVTWTGTVPIAMTDFGIDPPTALLGALKTGDDIQIEFNLVFE